MFPALLGFIDAVLLFVMPPEEFDERYNSKYLKRQNSGNWNEPPVKRQAPVRTNASRLKKSAERKFVMDYKKAGIEAFRSHDYENAIEAFEQALDLRFEDPALHFNLACCYSLMEDDQKAYYHLEHAVAFGFNDKGKIQDHDALAFLRSRKDFDVFEKNGYRRPEEKPAPLAANPEPVAMPNEADTGLEQLDLLEQISQLGKLRDLGVLTEEEFAEQKQKLLRI
jgi:tetratricopeptide (TPR) repeat protein